MFLKLVGYRRRRIYSDGIDIINDIYCFLVENREFNLFINNILYFR